MANIDIATRYDREYDKIYSHICVKECEHQVYVREWGSCGHQCLCVMLSDKRVQILKKYLQS